VHGDVVRDNTAHSRDWSAGERDGGLIHEDVD
jgi:hypothetical protein